MMQDRQGRAMRWWPRRPASAVCSTLTPEFPPSPYFCTGTMRRVGAGGGFRVRTQHHGPGAREHLVSDAAPDNRAAETCAGESEQVDHVAPGSAEGGPEEGGADVALVGGEECGAALNQQESADDRGGVQAGEHGELAEDFAVGTA